MTLTDIDRRIAHIRRTITREFGVLYHIQERVGGGIVTRGELMRAETKIKLALNDKGAKPK